MILGVDVDREVRAGRESEMKSLVALWSRSQDAALELRSGLAYDAVVGDATGSSVSAARAAAQAARVSKAQVNRFDDVKAVRRAALGMSNDGEDDDDMSSGGADDTESVFPADGSVLLDDAASERSDELQDEMDLIGLDEFELDQLWDDADGRHEVNRSVAVLKAVSAMGNIEQRVREHGDSTVSSTTDRVVAAVRLVKAFGDDVPDMGIITNEEKAGEELDATLKAERERKLCEAEGRAVPRRVYVESDFKFGPSVTDWFKKSVVEVFSGKWRVAGPPAVGGMTGVPSVLIPTTTDSDGGNSIAGHGHPRYCNNPVKKAAEQKHVDDLVELKVIRRVTPEEAKSLRFLNHVVLTPKPQNPEVLRFCIDLTAVNQVLIKGEMYDLPGLRESYDRLIGFKLYASFDLTSGFHQLPIAAADQLKTAFITNDGNYCYQMLPFGPAHASPCFQQAVDIIFRDPIFAGVLEAYIDDLGLGGNSELELLERIRQVVELADEHNVRFNLAKCKFGFEEIEYLGQLICETGRRIDPSRIQALRDLAEPSDTVKGRSKLLSFLGLCSYYRDFIPQLIGAPF
jgi:hypothetical protein